ncbi:MAG: winged helix-turn-helix transcriptional regulator [Euryarchaeota archaeon]|nr:winged helix-turn-helix transcriptional regulator [Euryarchaeota archaeon]MDE1837502.1 winged helix-turn-helix transcriptional regulator [Euryarchaeota archaeon]MDE1880542.1 winged helix-turn-helix transcriptional regulator [Euryarchaeota archaeon]MDE2045532.1 winged helix-turn-helix transcriptional regulator [Thermoplasmata archaeon]
MVDVFRLLAEPSRRQLLDALRNGERSVNELVGATHMSQPSVSKQLRILRVSGMVSLRASGRQHLYSVRGRSLREASEWLSYYEHFWQEGLSRMDKALQREPKPGTRRKP